MGVLVTIVWGHHMLAVVRRERPVGIGLARAFGFAAMMAVVIAGTFSSYSHRFQHWTGRSQVKCGVIRNTSFSLHGVTW
jgi:hypothetical protein